MATGAEKYVDPALRLGGAALLGIAALIGRHLFAAADPQAKFDPVAYLLALFFVGSLSTGAPLLVLGRHLFDQVELPSRWQIHDRPRRS
jgi:hypothetical protein